MAYSQVSITNVALGRIGARGQITSINDASPNAVKALAVWDFVFQEVLAERDWKFAKTRAQLQLSPVTPLYTYRYAWALPTDLLRFVRPVKRPDRRYAYWWGWGPEGNGWYHRNDPPFWPFDTDYKIETLTSGWLVAPLAALKILVWEARHNVCDGLSPNTFRYSTEKRPNSTKPKHIAISVTVVSL